MIIYFPNKNGDASRHNKLAVARIERHVPKGNHWVMAASFKPNGKRSALWIFYRAGIKGDFRWKAISGNGRIICASTEGYRQFSRAADNARIFGYSGPRTMRL
jgi:hypothetical protein